jgi:flagellar M-ring protein FliF
VSFSSNVPEAAPPMLERAINETGEVLREQPGLVKMLGAAGVIILLTLVVVRPMVRQIGAVLNPPVPEVVAVAVPELTAGELEALAEAEAAAKALGEPQRKAPPAFDKARGSKQAQVVYEHVSEQIRQDPVQSTRLLKSWIGEVGEEKD